MNYIISRSRKRTLNYQSTGYDITVEGENSEKVLFALNEMQKSEEARCLVALELFKVVKQSGTDIIKDQPDVVEKVKHKISDKGCRTCGELISWDGYDKEARPYPLHVDVEGYEIKGCYNG